ncbi:MAG: Rnf-Nqr domain containing protein [Gammaproteobacteria bacterium]|nr:hypothetical protein [Gammaproteobacteria bacterium]
MDTRNETWRNDFVLVAALCPLLAASDTLVSALTVGLAALVSALAASGIIAALGHWLERDLRFLTVVLVTTLVVAILDLMLSAWFHVARQSAGLYLLLIPANLALVHLNTEPHARGLLRRVATLMLAVVGVLLVMGLAREAVGRGSVLHDAQALIGSHGREITLFRVDMGFLLAMLPPGAFIALGLLLAVRNWLRASRTNAQ